MSEGLVLGGRYRLATKLGSGGMGSVWRAQDLNLGGEVAIKLIDPAHADSPEALLRFRREAQAAAAIRSTYVVQILDHGIDGDTPFIAMELLHGESLAARLDRVHRLDQTQAATILGHVGRALHLAHSKDIVHRDMKPENIFLVREGDEDVGKVLDFGVARSRGGFTDTGGLKTQTGTILGTPYYMSVEQATGREVDQLTDVWSFGVIAYECLLGQRAFAGESIGSLFHAICIARLPVPSEMGIVPAGFDDWFAHTIARDKQARYQTIKQACDDFRALCGRVSGRASAPDGRLGDSNHPTTVTLPTPGDATVAVVQPNGLQQTAPPSAHTVRILAHRKSIVALAVAFPLLSGLLGLGVFGWRSSKQMDGPVGTSRIQSSAANLGVPSAQPLSQSAGSAPSASVAPIVILVPSSVASAATSSNVRVPLEPVNPARAAPRLQSGNTALPPPVSPRRRNVSGL